ncbi:MAG TPA: outer membrane beta-barrel protein, partial [Roseomonas sp.]|nr:outer membrane beta-barrel protein [Roseomonas sp.]
MSLRNTMLLSAAVLALPLVARAEPVSGLYVGAGLGANWLESGTDTANLVTEVHQVEVRTEWGVAGVVSLGWGFGNGLRAEIEGNFRQNDVSQMNLSRVGNLAQPGGIVRNYGVMANLLYEFQLGPVQPYLGGGVGYIWHEFDNVHGRGPGGVLTFDGTEGGFGYQGILGLAVPITAVPGLALTAEYRFLGTTGNDVGGRIVRRNGRVDQVSYDAENFNQSIMFGVRYNFGQTAAPVAPAAAAPAPARTFLVFFDWNRDNLTDRARQIIAEAAQARTRQAVTRIEVNGYTDTSGSAQYNQGLSVR